MQTKSLHTNAKLTILPRNTITSDTLGVLIFESSNRSDLQSLFQENRQIICKLMISFDMGA